MNTIPFNWKTADFHHCVRADSIVYEPKRNKTFGLSHAGRGV